MKAPICDVCLNSNILCKACKEKLDKGIISESDVKVSKVINRLSKTLKPLREITIKRVLETERLTVIICEKGDAAKVVGKSGLVVKKLSSTLKKPLRVIEEGKNVKDFLQSVVYPTPVLGINILYTPEKEIFKLIIPRGKRVPMDEESLSRITKQMFGKESIIASES
jgi:transcription antitermination factor NusA-like protein